MLSSETGAREEVVGLTGVVTMEGNGLLARVLLGRGGLAPNPRMFGSVLAVAALCEL